MEFTEQTIMEFFRKAGQPSAAYRLMEFLRAENLMLVPVPEQADLDLEMRAIENYTGKKHRERVQDRT